MPRYDVVFPNTATHAAVAVVQDEVPADWNMREYGRGRVEDVFDVALYGDPEGTVEERGWYDDSLAALHAMAALANEGTIALALRAQIESLRAARLHDQLALYVAHVRTPDGELYGYEEASQLPLAELERLFEEDDYGVAWERFDSEDTEGYEQDEGFIRACDEILGLFKLRAES
jgi:hypothetical protein